MNVLQTPFGQSIYSMGNTQIPYAVMKNMKVT